MDQTVYKIALAAYLHDIGKFLQRSASTKELDDSGKISFYPDNEFMENHADLFQPQYNGKYTHRHALFTAAFIDNIEMFLPADFNKAQWGLGQPLINIAAAHHKPVSAMEWIVAVADRVSSGFERDKFEEYNKTLGNPSKYKQTRLLSMFEKLTIQGTIHDYKDESEFAYRNQLRELNTKEVFPASVEKVEPSEKSVAEEEYRKLFESFILALEKLEHRNYVPLWFEHFDSLFMIYGSCIPSATVRPTIPDVSLYDHCRSSSAIASALYRFHEESNTLSPDEVQNYDTKKFLLIQGNFYGIQDFIFARYGATEKAAAKILRGRSFYISLLTELAADLLLRELELPCTSLLMNAAGKFMILGYNTDKARKAVVKISDTINEWLIKRFYGETSIGVSLVEASCSDFTGKRFDALWDKLANSIEHKKCNRFDIKKYGGSFTGFLNDVNTGYGVCPFCGKRPAQPEALRISDDDDDMLYPCSICKDHIYLGQKLVKSQFLAVTSSDADLAGDKLNTPIFDRYQVSFDVKGKLSSIVAAGKVHKYWDISIDPNGRLNKKVTARFLAGYTPVYTEADNNDDRLIAGKKSEETRMALIEDIRNGAPKTFLHIAKSALTREQNGNFTGIEALAALKADVDNLGQLFACGMPPERMNISRSSALSRHLNFFFSAYLPYVLKTDKRFQNIYTVFAGGDDLFLMGPWNGIIDFADFLHDCFSHFICKNEQITISAGISIGKPGEPVPLIAERAEEALRVSKSSKKDSVSLFGATVTWKEFAALQKIKVQFEEWHSKGVINTAMLYRFCDICDYAHKEQIVRQPDFSICRDDFDCLAWRAKFKYSVTRNIGKMKGGFTESDLDEVLNTAGLFEKYGRAMRIPIWQILYERR